MEGEVGRAVNIPASPRRSTSPACHLPVSVTISATLCSFMQFSRLISSNVTRPQSIGHYIWPTPIVQFWPYAKPTPHHSLLQYAICAVHVAVHQHLFICRSATACPPVRLSACLSVRLSVCASLSLSTLHLVLPHCISTRSICPTVQLCPPGRKNSIATRSAAQCM